MKLVVLTSSRVGIASACLPVLQEGGKSAPRNTITINEFRKIKIEVKDFAVVSEGKQLGAGGNPLRMKDTKEGEVC